jgi:putative nucleotidyltransferase with HDIG domain
MSFVPSLEEQELLAATFQRPGSRLTTRERLSEAVVGSGFVLAVAGIWSLRPPHSVAVLPAALCLFVMVFATRVRFDTPFGFTVPTQLAFVPLLFALPVAIVPIAVVVALAIARLPEVAAGKMRPGRMVHVVGNSWFAIGPVLVFAVANAEPRNAASALLVGALAAQFVVDFSVSALRFRIGRGANFSEQLRETWVYVIDAGLSGIALVVAEDIHSTPVAALAPLPMLALLTVFARERHQRLESLLELNNAYRGTALVLGDVVGADDWYTGEHSKSVVGLALELAEALGFNAEQRRNVEFGALLHDVGKIAIPKEIINKPGKLDPAEWTIIKTHTIEGQKMLDRVGGFMHNVGLIVRSHHEHWDGSGYPDGLAGDAIALEARLIACCDAWNAMRTDRSYRKALTYDAACAELAANAGRQFDPRIVEALLGVVDRQSPTAAGDRHSAEDRI